MRYLSNILSIIIAALTIIGCTDFKFTPEVIVPSITSLFADPEAHAVTLTSSITARHTKVQCGFYVGKNKNTLTQYIGRIRNNEFSVRITKLEPNTTYWFKAYVTNGINEICTSLQTFHTLDDKTEEDKPVIPVINVDFDGNLVTVFDENSLTFRINLIGNSDQLDNAWFEYGNSPDQLTTRVNGTIEKSIMSGTTVKPEVGEYWVRACINYGATTKVSKLETLSITDPPQKPSIVRVSNTKAIINEDFIQLTANVSGDIETIQQVWFKIGNHHIDFHQTVQAELVGNEIKASCKKLDPANDYWVQAYAFNGTNTYESEKFSFNIEEQKPNPPIEKPDPPIEKPDPPIPPEDDAEVGVPVVTLINDNIVEVKATIYGNIDWVKEMSFNIGTDPYDMNMSYTAHKEGNEMVAYITNLAPGKQWIKANISNGYTTKTSDVASFDINNLK